ncbi:MAG: Histidine triad (HIT) protein [Parcubacteria bacterium C7867-007]|nr:MAG: Histidine triad (HIT) protein [Parcubacteria bacterium C7867-007]
MEDTIFTKIIRREVPADIVYEDADTLAFLDISPNSPGHTLVISKKPFVNIFDIDDETLAAVMRTVRKIAPAVRDAVGAKGVHINSNHGEEAGQVVPHLHFHIIPRTIKEEFVFWPKKDYAKGEAAAIAEQIRTQLAS